MVSQSLLARLVYQSYNSATAGLRRDARETLEAIYSNADSEAGKWFSKQVKDDAQRLFEDPNWHLNAWDSFLGERNYSNYR